MHEIFKERYGQKNYYKNIENENENEEIKPSIKSKDKKKVGFNVSN